MNEEAAQIQEKMNGYKSREVMNWAFNWKVFRYTQTSQNKWKPSQNKWKPSQNKWKPSQNKGMNQAKPRIKTRLFNIPNKGIINNGLFEIVALFEIMAYSKYWLYSK